MIVIGSRGSKLALWQAHHVSGLLNKLGAETRVEIIQTSGDKIQDWPLSKVGGKGLFTKEIEEALLNKTIDLAVHSLKDVPTVVGKGLVLAAIPEREEPRDALIGSKVADLRAGMRVGTSSLRRSAQLLTLNNGLSIEMLRGNVDTRLRKLDEGKYDAIVLAAAGLRRLGWQDRITELIPVDAMCPAVGQGALAIETRQDHGPAHEIAATKLNNREAEACVMAERALLEALNGDCHVPVGAYATMKSRRIDLQAVVVAVDGSKIVRGNLSGTDPVQLGTQLGERLLNEGAREILIGIFA